MDLSTDGNEDEQFLFYNKVFLLELHENHEDAMTGLTGDADADDEGVMAA